MHLKTDPEIDLKALPTHGLKSQTNFYLRQYGFEHPFLFLSTPSKEPVIATGSFLRASSSWQLCESALPYVVHLPESQGRGGVWCRCQHGQFPAFCENLVPVNRARLAEERQTFERGTAVPNTRAVSICSTFC